MLFVCVTCVIYAGEQQVGVLDARGVVPVAGNVLVFPHGGTRGSLVHEGSAVTQVSSSKHVEGLCYIPIISSQALLL